MLKSALISLTSVVLCLLVTEAGLRAYYSFRLDYQIEMCRYAAKVKRSGPASLSHDHLPNSSAHLMGVDVSINSHGFRDGEYPAKKPADVYRIMLLGDSLTFGWGAEANCRFGNVLERDLNADLQG